jgi:hypothetical protein
MLPYLTPLQILSKKGKRGNIFQKVEVGRGNWKKTSSLLLGKGLKKYLLLFLFGK